MLNNASILFANQLVGAATSLNELVLLCDHFDTSRLATQGYNVTLIKDRICAASELPTLQSNSEISDLTSFYSTEIWIAQLITAVLGDTFLLCDFINVPAADSVGLNATLVELALQCTRPNDGGPPSTSSTPSAKTRRAIATRAAYVVPLGSPVPAHHWRPSLSIRLDTTTEPQPMEPREALFLPPGSPVPSFNFPSSLSIHVDSTPAPEMMLNKRIQPKYPQPTASTTKHHYPGEPNVTPSPDLPHATLPPARA